NYSNEIAALDKQIPPLSRPAEISWDYSDSTEDYFKDRTAPTALAVVNSAGEPFETNPQRERGDLFMVITRNEASHDAAADDTYSNTSNSDPVLIDGTLYGIGMLLCKPIKTAKVTETFQGSDITY